MGFKLGYNQLDKGNKFYISFPLNLYKKFIRKIGSKIQNNATATTVEGKTPLIKFYTLTSTYSTKYALKLKDLFIYNHNDPSRLINFNAELSTKSKMMRMINFDITPIVKFTLNNLPFNSSIKYGHYHANRNQHLNGSYDFSKVLKSMLPYHRIGLSIFNTFSLSSSSLYKIKGAFNRIFSFEDNIKVTNHLRTDSSLSFPFLKLLYHNDFIMKKAFTVDKILRRDNASNYIEHHILSGFQCFSRLLEMNMLHKEREIDNGCDFYMNNVTTLRLGIEDMTFIPQAIRSNDFIRRLYPFASIETFIIPSLKNWWQCIYSCGLSIKLQEGFFVDLSFHSGASSKVSIKKEYINRFRIKISN